jgi:DNA (cytosine-5)-methyltransferase 1
VRGPTLPRTAVHRPARRRRRYRHDDLVAVDLFSGFGGLTQGIKQAGFTTIMAANHNRYKVEVHEANHPEAEHWIADLVDRDSSDYHSARDLPAADLLVAGVSCTNHSQANTTKAYAQGASLFDLDDPDFDERVTRSERDRATANCVLHYADTHHPRLILVECTTELQSWGPAVPGKRKVGDGSTYRWWLRQFDNLGYRHRVLYLNSMFFGVPQSRDRLYIAFWDKRLHTPDLDHRPHAWCTRCQTVVESVWTWRTGIPPTGSVRYGKQYDYRCPGCATRVLPPVTPSLAALDLTDLGTRIGDRERPLAAATMARAERCRQRFADFPAILMPAKAVHGVERHPWQPMSTQTSQQETALLSTGVLMAAAGHTYEAPGSDCRSRGTDQPLWAQTGTLATGLLAPPVAIATGQVLAAHRHNGDGKHLSQPMDTVTSTHEKALLLAVDNYQGAPRAADEPLPTQVGSETLGLLSAAVLPNRTNGTPRASDQPMQTLVGNAGSGGLAVLSSGVLPFRQNTVPTTHGEAMPTVTAEQLPGLLTAAGTIKNNGSIDEAGYRSHPVSSPLGTVVGSAITQGMLSSGWYKQNGSSGSETAPHPLTDPLGLTSRDTTALLNAEWRAALADLQLEDCYFRMMAAHEVGRGCGFDVDFADHRGSFQVWGSARDQVDGFGNAVSPAVGTWIGDRLRAALHGGSS